MAVVDVEKIEQDVFTAIRALIIANKPTYTRTDQGVEEEFTYNVEAEYPRENPSFPMIVINEPEVDIALINMDGSGEDYPVEVQLDFYAKEIHGKKAISEGKDPMRATFIGNRTSFDIDNGLLMDKNFWNDSNTSFFKNDNQLINTASVVLKFRLK